MTVNKFEKKYSAMGGIAKLTELRSLLFSRKYIATHFKVSQERVGQWMLEFFGSYYDYTDERAEAVIQGMLDFAKNNYYEEFRRAFRNSPYYKRAIEEIKKQKIYADIK